jgi:hypothetical protein
MEFLNSAKIAADRTFTYDTRRTWIRSQVLTDDQNLDMWG